MKKPLKFKIVYNALKLDDYIIVKVWEISWPILDVGVLILPNL